MTAVAVQKRTNGARAQAQALQVTVQGIECHAAPTFEEFDDTYARIHTMHNATLWCLGDLYNIGEQYFSEEWFQAVGEDDYDHHYLEKLARVCRAFPISVRYEPRLIPFTSYRLLAVSWIPQDVAMDILDVVASDKWTKARIEDWKQAMWQRWYDDMPYEPHYTRNADAAFYDWDENGGRERYMAQQAAPDPKALLHAEVQAFRARVLDLRGAPLAYDVALAYADRLEVLVERIKA